MTNALVALFRRFLQPAAPAKMEPIVIPKHGPTAHDIEAIGDFISLRLALITPSVFPTPGDVGRAILALGDTAEGARSMAASLLTQGTNAVLPWVILAGIAGHWRDHPDYQPEWATIV